MTGNGTANGTINANNAGMRTANTVKRPIAISSRGGLPGNAGANKPIGANATQSFADELRKAQTGAARSSVHQSGVAQNGVKISKHAEMRLSMRNINLTDVQRQKLSSAIELAHQKGVNDTLVILDGIALVANVKSRTIVTAVDSGSLKQNVFTNIDGAVFA